MKFFLPLLLLLSALRVHADDRAARVLSEINLARTLPAAYAEVVAQHSAGIEPRAVQEAIAFLRRARPLQPLRFSEEMSAGALLHVIRQGQDGTLGHTGSDRSRPWDRLAEFGEWSGAVGENIHYGNADARQVVVALIVDAGVRGRGHRKNIFTAAFNVAGVARGPHRRFGSMCVIDFAGGFVPERARTALAKTEGGYARDL